MSKSKGNFFTFRDLERTGLFAAGDAIFAFVGAVSQAVEFHVRGIAGSRKHGRTAAELSRAGPRCKDNRWDRMHGPQHIAKALTDFEAAMDDDFNTAAALAAVHNLVREINTVLAKDGLARRQIKPRFWKLLKNSIRFSGYLEKKIRIYWMPISKP